MPRDSLLLSSHADVSGVGVGFGFFFRSECVYVIEGGFDRAFLRALYSFVYHMIAFVLMDIMLLGNVHASAAVGLVFSMCVE